MYRDAEKQFKSALKEQQMVDTYLYLGKVYTRLDQPKTSIEVYKQGLEKFPGETALLTGIARIQEVQCTCASRERSVKDIPKYLVLESPQTSMHLPKSNLTYFTMKSKF